MAHAEVIDRDGHTEFAYAGDRGHGLEVVLPGDGLGYLDLQPLRYDRRVAQDCGEILREAGRDEAPPLRR